MTLDVADSQTLEELRQDKGIHPLRSIEVSRANAPCLRKRRASNQRRRGGGIARGVSCKSIPIPLSGGLDCTKYLYALLRAPPPAMEPS